MTERDEEKETLIADLIQQGKTKDEATAAAETLMRFHQNVKGLKPTDPVEF